jgi:O-Antigen ligase
VLRKAIIFVLMLLYIYVLTFDIFLNQYFKFPAVFIGILLALVFREPRSKTFIFSWELWFLFLANFFYYAIGQSELKPLVVNFSIFACCAFYFNFFVGQSRRRLNLSVMIFFSFLALSVLVMCADHLAPSTIVLLREKLIGSQVVQSPSGISTNIFTFGYQVAAFSTFVFLYTIFKRKHFVLVGMVFLICLVPIFYGMQRSALIVFGINVVLSIIIYFRLKAIPILVGIGACCFIFFSITSSYNTSTQYNILNKAEQNAEMGENRAGLITENIKIYSDYPFGLVFYNRKWSEVSQHNPTYQGGLTSHNGYLMFFTYLGPIVGLFFLIAIYRRLILVFRTAILNIRNIDFALSASLCFAFLALSMNSLFHNAWLINANGPTVFLFFCILQLNEIKLKQEP